MNLEAAMNKIYDVIQAGGTLKEACSQANVHCGAHYHWLKSYPGYREGYDLAIQLRNRVLEDALVTRAIDGQLETRVTFTVLPDGSKIPVEEIVTRRFDNALAIRMLAAQDERYNPRIKPAEIAAGGTVAEAIINARKRLQEARESKSE